MSLLVLSNYRAGLTSVVGCLNYSTLSDAVEFEGKLGSETFVNEGVVFLTYGTMCGQWTNTAAVKEIKINSIGPSSVKGA